MRDACGTILYVGKAKSLRQRLGSYRVANPDRVPKRLLRLLKSVECIELEECDDEAAALAREAELLLELKPRFNRAGVWSAPSKFLAWRVVDAQLELKLVAALEEGWKTQGPLKGGSAYMFAALIRVLWVATRPELGLNRMPVGWFRGRLPELVALPKEAEAYLQSLIGGAEAVPVTEESVLLGWHRELLVENQEAVIKYFQTKTGA